MSVLPVTGESPYDVVVGRGLAGEVPTRLGPAVQRVALIVGEPLQGLASGLRELLEASYDVLVLPVPEGEHAKSAAIAVDAWEQLGRAGFTRSDAVVTFGGGATTDLGGFIAATWLRGVAVIHVPTTVLGMVDAAVGGKTGINTGSGKNLVGAFHEPRAVICDLALLETLPVAEIRAGLGEVIKCGFIADPAILDLVETRPDEAQRADSTVLRELIERAIRVKIDVVATDLRETGGPDSAEGHDAHPGREALNYGHTLAHAIERVTDYTVRHGEAVSLGCVYVAELGRRTGHIDDALADRHVRAFSAVGLPVTWSGAPFTELLDAMRVDKKSRGSQLRFVVLDGLARPRILAGPDEADLGAAYDALGGSR